MTDTLARCLDDLEERLDPAEEDCLADAWRAFALGGFHDEIFSPRRTASAPPRTVWPVVRVNEALNDPEAMLLQQYGECSRQLEAGGGAMLNVRANYGSSILPMLFGVEPFIMPDEYDTLPTSWPLNNTEAVQRVVDAGLPELTRGFGAQVLDMGRRFNEIAKACPRIGRYAHIYHPDLQGPLDAVEVIWGSSIFTAFFETPGLVHALLELVTQTYTAFMREWQRIVPFSPEGNCHWGCYHRGGLMLRLDSAMNISPQLYAEFSRPYDQRLLDAFNGGAVHFCGKGDHFIESLSGLNGLYAVNLSQPRLNDMERIFAHTVDKGIVLLMLERACAEDAIHRGRDLRGRVHCF